ncbi:hypothetical protein M569_02128 [Genlisea aurea]|uniref:Protein kinase domain-containing protein n=1 Tax=Genlisea aurea TaxID=192259 RepID=S8D5C3_9LAMI|nr:hypothetical protein M569_02128 [Genlisea aurea]
MLKVADYALFLMLGYCSFWMNVSCLNDEGMALLSFKKSIEEDPRAALVNWNPSDSTPCSWDGVKCENQTVISIRIPLKNLSGPLPAASLGSLSNLRHLNIRSNRFSGEFSPEIFRARKLRSLVLSRNSLSGILPPEMGNLKNLENLVFSENEFSGPLDQSLFRCEKLRRLLLSRNNFSGALPHGGLWENLPLLERLDLSYNSFGGSIPSELGSLSNLKRTLDLSHNQFTGPIPSSLGELSSKVYVDLSYNNLSGPIPMDVGDLMCRKPITFVGNPKLCGFPLPNPCPSSPSPSPSPGEEQQKGSVNLGRLIGSAVIDINVLFIASFLCFYCKRSCCRIGKRAAAMEEFACFERDTSSSENSVQYGLVCLDSELNIDAEKLFRSSASVFSSSGLGILYKVELDGGLELAVKRLKTGGGLIRVEEQFDAEMEAVSKIKHDNVLSIRAYYLSITEFLLISDFIPNGNLAAAIRCMMSSPLPWPARLRIMKGVARGLTHLHEKHVHGDLKPSNILLGNGMEPKISDFRVKSLAKLVNRFDDDDDDAASFIPSSYRAPELIRGSKASRKSDVYSFGVISLEVIRGRTLPFPFPFGEMQKKQPSIDPFLLLQVPDQIDGIMTVFEIAASCTADKPEMRPPIKLVANSLERVQAQ